jgi:hypothetical protein
MNLKYLERDNKCEMTGYCVGTTHNFYRSASSFPCFAAAFHFINEYPHRIYEINYILYIRKDFHGYYNNFSLISKQDMHRILNAIKYMIPFQYSFDETEDYYAIRMQLTGTGLQHKGLLTLSRMLFEFPHNMVAQDILRIREIGILGDIDIRKYSIIELYTIFISSMWHSLDESLVANFRPNICSPVYIKDKLKSKRRLRISRIITQKKYIPVQYNLPDTTEQMEKEFSTRISIYSKNLKSNLNA